MLLTIKKTLNLELAKHIATAAEKEAAANGWTMVIAVLDDGGSLIYLVRMDDTQIGSIEVAQMKARTALRFKRPSKAFEEALVGGRIDFAKDAGFHKYLETIANAKHKFAGLDKLVEPVR